MLDQKQGKVLNKNLDSLISVMGNTLSGDANTKNFKARGKIKV